MHQDTKSARLIAVCKRTFSIVMHVHAVNFLVQSLLSMIKKLQITGQIELRVSEEIIFVFCVMYF